MDKRTQKMQNKSNEKFKLLKEQNRNTWEYKQSETFKKSSD